MCITDDRSNNNSSMNDRNHKGKEENFGKRRKNECGESIKNGRFMIKEL